VECSEWADAVRLSVLNEDVEVVDLREKLLADRSMLGSNESGRAGTEKTS
jgi:hypothetical protein